MPSDGGLHVQHARSLQTHLRIQKYAARNRRRRPRRWQASYFGWKPRAASSWTLPSWPARVARSRRWLLLPKMVEHPAALAPTPESESWGGASPPSNYGKPGFLALRCSCESSLRAAPAPTPREASMWQAPGSVETLQRGNCADSPERELQEQAQGTACPSTDTARRAPA